jgi:hypothetical protein
VKYNFCGIIWKTVWASERIGKVAKRVIYTNIIGDYERLNEELVPDFPGIPLLCFTDNKNLKSDKWNCVYIEPKFSSDPIRSSRYLKIIGHELLNEFEEIMWVDNCVQLKPNAVSLFNIYLKSNDLAIPIHSFRENLKEEFITVLDYGYDDPRILLNQMNDYNHESSEILKSKVFWNGIILKRNNLIVKDAMRLWFDQLLKYSKRDQLSLPYVLSKVKINFESINIDNFESEFHKWPISLNRKSKHTQENKEFLSNILNIMSNYKLKQLEESRNLEVKQLQEVITNLRVYIKESDMILKGIISSNSWKLTNPLRKLVKIFKSL